MEGRRLEKMGKRQGCSMSTGVLPAESSPTIFHHVGRLAVALFASVGDLTLFSLQTFGWILAKLPRGHVFWPICYEVGVCSVPVVLVTGMFIGMVLAVQSYDTLRIMHFESQLGSVVNASLIKELGPVLAATMLAGRVGCAIAAEVGTMKVTEQVDALRALGADPIAYLVVPRVLACFLLIPALTVLADAIGILGGWLVSTQMLGVNNHYYWLYSENFVTAYDFLMGIVKSMFFGAFIALVACHRGFQCGSGAEGVGRAATQAFVAAFVIILATDFLLGLLFLRLYYVLF
jgi:phospholipid/cholesterol/gamma-HCH transport system permease protein